MPRDTDRPRQDNGQDSILSRSTAENITVPTAQSHLKAYDRRHTGNHTGYRHGRMICRHCFVYRFLLLLSFTLRPQSCSNSLFTAGTAGRHHLLPWVKEVFGCQASLLDHHALEVASNLGMSVHGYAGLPRGKGQVLGPVQGFHEVGVGSLGGVVSTGVTWLVGVWSMRHHVGRRGPALLHPSMHCSGIVQEVGHVRWGLGTPAACGSVVAVQVQDLFGALWPL